MIRLILFSFFLGILVFSVNAQTNNSQTQIRYLSGTGNDNAVSWDFYCTAGRKSGVWTKIVVPSCWEQQGFGGYNYGGGRISETNPLANEQGKYRLQFDIPAAWKNKIIRIVFDGVMTDTEVHVNGQLAGPIHQGSFYQFKYDITPLVKVGEANLLEVTVSKVSANESINRAERFGSDYWVFGGIFRPVYLEALPQQFVDWTGIDARADGSFLMDVHLGGKSPASVDKVTAQIIDSKGAKVGNAFDAATTSTSQGPIKLQTTIKQPKLWTAETPNLYTVRLTLFEKSKPIHTITERFGFRTFEVRTGDGLYLNGQRIILKGTNRHTFWPETARTTSRKISYDDARLIKEMNNNAVRMSHYPPDVHFLEACDKLGIYVLDELAGWQRSYDTPTGRRLIGQMIRRDVNHPSILFWDNGNEGGWNKENDDEFAKWDLQKRHVLHPWDLFGGVNTDHYEKYNSHTRLSAGADIYMPTEILHALYDGGAGAGLWDYWELIRKSKVGGGGFIWALVDECIVRTDQNGRLDCAGNQGPDGIVGPHREKEGSFNTVREIWSPVQVVSPKKLPDDFSGTLTVENRYDFTNLNECSFKWQLARFPAPHTDRSGHTNIASGTIKGPNIPPHGTGEVKIPLPAKWQNADVLYLSAIDPNGSVLWTWSWSLKSKTDFAQSKSNSNTGQIQTKEENGLLIVDTKTVELRFSKATGSLTEARRNGTIIPFGNGPRFVAFQRDDRKYKDVAGQNSLTDFVWSKEKDDVVIKANYSGALKYVRWRVVPDGNVHLEYEYTFNGPVDMVGVQFDASENKIKKIRWLGMGPYRVWQNRMKGAQLDVWENGYNDTTPGESWVYPEFKGYFRDWQWASFDTTEGKIILMSGEHDSFLGVYKPKDGKDGLLTFPDTGIAFLDVIPSIRNKFHTADEIGPESMPREVSGTKRRSIYMWFGRR